MSDSINKQIQDSINNPKITSNPDIKNSLGISDTEDTSEFDKHQSKLDEFEKFVSDNVIEKTEELSKMNKHIDGNSYHEMFYSLELYKFIQNKFFDKQYFTHPKIRLSNIKGSLEEKINKYNHYLVSIKYTIKTEEDIEAYETEFLAKTLLSEHLSEQKVVKPITEVVKEVVKEAQSITPNKTKLSAMLQKIEDDEAKGNLNEEVALKELSEFDKADIKGKITLLWDKVVKKAEEIDEEKDGIVFTYVNTLYNPATSTLDSKNLLLNLLIISKMQDFSNMGWDFTTDENKVKSSNTEIELKNTWWNKILSEKIEDELKWVKIVEKDLNQAFYKSFLLTLIKKADKSAINERMKKMKKLFEDSVSDSPEELILNALLKKTQKGSIVFITPDLEKFITVDREVKEELGERNQIKYLGVWEQRHVFVINTDKLAGFDGYSNELIYVNKGNSWILNPEKPIVYFDYLSNPFIEKGIIKWWCAAEFNISMDKSGRLQVDSKIME